MKRFDKLTGGAYAGLTEIPEARGLTAKVFDVGFARHKLVTLPAVLHWRNGSDWDDVDLTPRRQDDGMWRVDRAPYKLIVDPNTATLRHESRQHGARARVGLKAIGGVPIESLPEPVVEDGRITWPNVIDGIDIELHIRHDGAEWFKRLHRPDVPNEITWKVERRADMPSRQFRLRSEGMDADSQKLRMHSMIGRKRISQGWEKFDYTERFERQVSKVVDRRTRRRGFSDDVKYPILIDVPDITETPNDSDDVATAPGYFWPNGIYDGRLRAAIWYGDYVQTGIRFTSLAIPQGQSIDLAELKMYQVSPSNTNITATWYGSDVDDVGAWSTPGNLPRDITRTTASTAAVLGTNNTYVAHDVTDIVQEIVDRGGWSSGNDLAFLCAVDGPGGQDNGFFWEDTGGSNPPTLEVTFAAVPVTGTGGLVADSPDVAGEGVSLSTGAGSLEAASSTVDGSGVSGSVATGALAAESSTINGVALDPITGTGALSTGPSRVRSRPADASASVRSPVQSPIQSPIYTPARRTLQQ